MPDPETDPETAIRDSAKTGQETWYVTTAIPYVNAPPHIGFALEMILADVLARYRRRQGYQVRFQAGSDENSLKNVQAAEAAGLDTETLVAANARKFLELGPALNLSVDDFIRTSAEPRHKSGVQRLWRACAAAGDIYKKAYSGLYCVGCEQFYKPAELQAGLCPEHRSAARGDLRRELLLPSVALPAMCSREAHRLRDACRSSPKAVGTRFCAGSRTGLEDFSISRSSDRARGWGIPVPGDAEPGHLCLVRCARQLRHGASGMAMVAMAAMTSGGSGPTPTGKRARDRKRASHGSTRSIGRPCCCRLDCTLPRPDLRARLCDRGRREDRQVRG